MEHLVAQEAGKETFFEEYRIRVAKVEREYAWDAKDGYKKL